MSRVVVLLVIYSFLAIGILHVPSHAACTNCEFPWREYGDYCYLMVTDKRNFGDAENHCQSLSKPGRPSHLISIGTAEENTFLKNYTIDALGGGHFALWIGYYLASPPSTFAWTDGMDYGGYHNFKVGEPTLNGNEDCVVLWYGEEWNDFFCGYTGESVCKAPSRFSPKRRFD